jgi:hypothetical protein
MIIAAFAAVMPFTGNFANDHFGSEGTPEEQVIRKDRTKADLSTPADRNEKEAFDRTVTLADNGMYSVVITDASGNLRMKGTYLDDALKVPHGEFTYYYTNGNVESNGRYEKGWKTGVWNRFAEDGSPKAERVYTGMTWDDMAVMLGAQ